MSTRDELDMWLGWIQSPVTKELIDIAQQQAQVRQVEVLSPMKPGQEYERELMKGEALGITMFIAVAETRIAELREIVEKERENDDRVD